RHLGGRGTAASDDRAHSRSRAAASETEAGAARGPAGHAAGDRAHRGRPRRYGRDDGGQRCLHRSLVIAGIGLAALLFLLAVAVPSTAARYTPPGRLLMDHQTDLVLVGVALLLLAALLFAVVGHGS